MTNNAAAFRALDSKIAMLQVITDLPETAVPAVAETIDREIKRTASAGCDAYGTPWTPKKDGTEFRFFEVPDIITGSIGKTIITRIKTRQVVLHNNGYARGEVERRVLPKGGTLPPAMSAAIKQALIREFRRVTRSEAA